MFVRDFSYYKNTTDLVEFALKKGLINKPINKWGTRHLIFSFDDEFIAFNGYETLE